MRRSWSLLLAALTLALSMPAQAKEDSTSFREAAKASLAWLTLMDAENYQASWDTASTRLQQYASRKDWSTQAKEQRNALGPVLRRKQILEQGRHTSDMSHSLYFVLIYETNFQKRGKMFETLTLVRDKDHWQVAAYVLK